MKIICYSIFRAPCEDFEFKAYLRGLYFNARMNKLIYPDWRTCIVFSKSVYTEYKQYAHDLHDSLGVIIIEQSDDVLCKAMLWIMLPLFCGPAFPELTHIICRDADAITTYKEAQAVEEWVNSGLGFHGITDNPAHSLPMMGGMVGFKADHFRQLFPKWKTFEDMTKRFNLSKHGSDQQLLMSDIYPKAKGSLFVHAFDGYTGDREVKRVIQWVTIEAIPGVSPKLWESNLTCRHIGSAGIVDMETLRFFKRFDKTDYSEFEKKHSDICYWRR
jgi:hypothetical protein